MTGLSHLQEGEVPWTMPDWMEPLRPLIRWHEGHRIEDVINDEIEKIAQWREVSVKAQVDLLYDLHGNGMLTPTKENQ